MMYISKVEQARNVLAENNVSLVEFDLSCFWDFGTSRMDFDDFIAEIEGKAFIGKGRDGIEYIVVGEIDKPHYTKKALKSMSKAVLWDLVDEYELYSSCGDDADNYTKIELVNMLYKITEYQHYEKQYDQYDWYSLESTCTFTATGHGQGDAVLVLIVGKLEKVNLGYITRDYIENIFYNAPLHCSIEVIVNGEVEGDTLQIDYEVADSYKYDKEEIIEIAKRLAKPKHAELLAEYLAENLPEYPEYLY